MSSRLIQLNVRNFLGIDAVQIEPDGNLVVLNGPNGAGKAQPLSEPVLTPTGWRAMGELKPGDRVVGVDGKPVDILSVHPQTEREVWKITFSDGSWTRCSPDHLWTVRKWKRRSKIERTLTTAEILEIGLQPNAGGPGRWEIPLVETAVHREALDFPVDPWQLGVLLGDGHIVNDGKVNGHVVLTTDAEILERLGVRGRRDPSRRSDKVLVGSSSKWRSALADLGLLGTHSWDKFVPAQYLLGSADQRSALLAGLLDTDGHASPTGGVEFSSTSEALTDAVVELVQSLGGIAKKSGPRITQYTHNDEKRDGRPSWRVRVTVPFNPFTLSRKRDAYVPNGERTRMGRWISAIERVEDEDCQCIRIDRADGLYLTRHHIVTHNTSILTAIWALLASKAGLKNIDQPVHNGKGTAVIEGVIDLGDGETLRITRSFTAAGGMNIKVMAGDGSMAVRSPETALKKLFTSISFDPLAFSKMKGKEQVEVYLRAVDTELDLDELNVKRAQIYDQRTEINREVDTVTKTLQGLPESTASAEDEEVSGASILAEQQAAQEQIEKRWRYNESLNAKLREFDQNTARVTELRRLLEEAEEDQASNESEIGVIQAEIAKLPPDPNLTGFAERLTAIEETNRQIRLAKQRAALEVSRDEGEAEAQKYSALLDAIDMSKRAVIAKVPQIVPGLTFDEEGMIFNGVPLAQASGSERLLVSCQVGIALNPEVRVMTVQDGPLLDTSSMELLERIADEHDFQVWIERQMGTDAEGVGFTISEGHVIARPAAGKTGTIMMEPQVGNITGVVGGPVDMEAIKFTAQDPPPIPDDEMDDEAAVDAFFETLGIDGEPEPEPPTDDAPPIWEALDDEF